MSSAVVDEAAVEKDSECEVRQLQELVKKLQHQNQILLKREGSRNGLNADLVDDLENVLTLSDSSIEDKNSSNLDSQGVSLKAGGTININSSLVLPLREQKLNSTNCRFSNKTDENSGSAAVGEDSCASVERKLSIPESAADKLSLDTVGLIDVDRLALDEEDSWLLQSPPPQKVNQKSMPPSPSPFKWLREDFEQLSPELTTMRRSLAIKLDEVTRLSNFETSKKLVQNFEKTRKNAAAVLADRGDVVEIIKVEPTGVRNAPGRPNFSKPPLSTRSPKNSPRGSPQPGLSRSQHTLELSEHQPIDGTSKPYEFRRNTTRGSSVTNFEDIAYQDSDNRPLGLAKAGEAMKRTSASEENLLSSSIGSGGCYRLNDVTDVKQLARMQEESLRLSLNSPLLSRKGLSKSLNRSSGALVVDDGSSPDLQEALAMANGLRNSSGSLLQRTRSSAGDSRRREVQATSTPKLDSATRHTSRSAGNLLSPTAERMPMSQSGVGLYRPMLNAGKTVAASTLPTKGRSENMAKRSDVHTPVIGSQRNNGVRTSKSEIRSTSLHGPRKLSRMIETPVQGRKTSLTLTARGTISTTTGGSTTGNSKKNGHSEPIVVADMAPLSPGGTHRQSMPNLSRSGTKLSIAKSLRLSDQQLASIPLSTTGGPEHPLANSHHNTVTPVKTTPTSGRQPMKATMAQSGSAAARHPQSPTTPTGSKQFGLTTTGGEATTTSRGSASAAAPRQQSRIVTPSKLRIPSPSSRRSLVSATTTTTTVTNDDSWKDGCF